MESDLQPHHYNLTDLQSNQKQMNSTGLTRYQSAPSSYFSGIMDRDFCDEFLNRPTSPETERIFARFLQSTEENQNLVTQKETEKEMDVFGEIDDKTGIIQQKHQEQSFYQNQSQQHNLSSNPIPVTGSGSIPSLDYRLPETKIRGVSGGASSLVRQSSSPAGLFSQINILENGYNLVRNLGEIGGSKRPKQEASFTSARPPSSPARLLRHQSVDAQKIYPMLPSWDNSDNISASASKSLVEDNRTVSMSESEGVEGLQWQSQAPLLAHHLSLPKSLSDMSSIEQFLHLSDSVPCKIRAKRGFATHPRSIAERVRRTRISERMKKLQDLVPNMDKQTNTSDMLDLAVEYIKDLQTEVKRLSENRARCSCSNIERES